MNTPELRNSISARPIIFATVADCVSIEPYTVFADLTLIAISIFDVMVDSYPPIIPRI